MHGLLIDGISSCVDGPNLHSRSDSNHSSRRQAPNARRLDGKRLTNARDLCISKGPSTDRRLLVELIAMGPCRRSVTHFLITAVPAAQTLVARPNVVFFLADDLGWSDLGCYGSRFYEPPHIDGLAASGARFTQAYAACPVCSPTRASIMTGKYPVRPRVTDYISPTRGNQPGNWNRNTKLLPSSYSDRMPLQEATLAEAFREGGYATFFGGCGHCVGHAQSSRRARAVRCNAGRRCCRPAGE